MSMFKKDAKKPAAKPDAESAKTRKTSGTSRSAFVTDEDGNTHEATPEEMANAKAALVTVASETGDGIINEVTTYECHIKNLDNGNIVLAIRTSNTLDDTEVDNPKPLELDGDKRIKNNKITLVGRGNSAGAAFALVACYRAYASPFGQEFSHRLVRMELNKETKDWFGLFVPAMTIAAM